MKTHLSILQKRFAYFLLSVLAIGSFTSCQKESADYVDIPAAGLMAYNLAPDLREVAFIVGTVPISGGLSYTSHTGNYVPVEAGDRQVGAYNVSAGTTLSSQTIGFSENARYSTFLIGSNGNYRTVLSLDNNGSVERTGGKAWVRYIHAIGDNAGTADITIAGQTETATYGTVTDFRPIDPGTATVEISDVDNFATSRTINFEENKLYTVMFVGMPGATDPQLAPQTRFMVSAAE